MEEKKERKVLKEEESETPLPPLDFSSVVLPFYTQALVCLGVIEDPATGQKRENLKLAQRLIDLLDLLKQRTEGRLLSPEEHFLASCLHQLKWHYLEKTKFIKT